MTHIPQADYKTETVTHVITHDRFSAWVGRDFWHQDRSVQIRLEADGSVLISTEEGHVSTLRNITITFDRLYELMRRETLR